jgi:hypothetical protein
MERLKRVEKDLTDVLSRSISRADTIAITDALEQIAWISTYLEDTALPVQTTVNEYTAGGTA